jgi:hypothetical protein
MQVRKYYCATFDMCENASYKIWLPAVETDDTLRHLYSQCLEQTGWPELTGIK